MTEKRGRLLSRRFGRLSRRRQAEGLCGLGLFYGGKIVAYADEAPLCPTQMHFGEQDQGIPLSDVKTIREKRPDCDIHIYPAGHRFNSDERGSYHAKSAALAWKRSLAFIKARAG